MKNSFCDFWAIIEHEQYAGKGSSHIIGVLNVPEEVYWHGTEHDAEKALENNFREWYKYTYGENPYPTSLKWWTFERALVQVSTDKADIWAYINKN